MIKLDEALELPEGFDNWSSISEYVWTHLNFTKNGNVKVYSNINGCQKVKDIINSDGYEVASNEQKQRQLEFINMLMDNDYLLLKELFTSIPDNFPNLIDRINRVLINEDLFTINNTGKKSQTNFGKLLIDEIFTYSKFRSSRFAISLYKNLGLGKDCYCPYCNNDKITISKKVNGTDAAYFELDHFYPKVINPYLAMAFFNLIPSCHTCNSNVKGDTEFTISTHVNPYHKSFHEQYEFRIEPIDYHTLTTTNISVVARDGYIEDSTIQDLNITNRYANKKDKIDYLINFMHRNQHNLEDDERLDLIKDIIFDLQIIPTSRSKIFWHENGKLVLDILSNVDLNNRLGVDY